MGTAILYAPAYYRHKFCPRALDAIPSTKGCLPPPVYLAWLVSDFAA